MQPTGIFTRRVCAVLLADVSRFSALMGEDDDRTARAVQELQTVVGSIVAEGGGTAEASAGDAIFATFESVAAAFGAAVDIQRRLATETFVGRRLLVRIGVHFGDVLLREGAAFGDAINIAARLQALARPGTICISDGVYRQVRNKFDQKFIDLGRQRLKNISDPVHAYLVVPHEMAGLKLARPRWRTWAVGGAAGALIAASGVALVHYFHATAPKTSHTPVAEMGPFVKPIGDAAPAESAAVALGVMLFKSRGEDGQKDWRSEALRDGLNTQLSQLSGVKVYSKEFIDFLITRRGLTEIEAASQLGIRDMLSGSIVSAGGKLLIETHVVNVPTGVLKASFTTACDEPEFPDLQRKLALEVIARLDLPITPAERQTLLARQDTNADALKMLLDAERGGGERSAAPSDVPAPQSSVARWLAYLPLVPSAALAQQQPGAETAINDVLERYRRAMEAREVQALATLYAEFSPDQQAAQQKYFENVRDLHVAIDHVDVAVVGDEAVASYTRTDDFVDVRTGRPIHVAVRLTKTLRKDGDSWKLVSGK